MKSLRNILLSTILTALSGCAGFTVENANLAKPVSDITKAELVAGKRKTDGVVPDKALIDAVDGKRPAGISIDRLIQAEPGKRRISVSYVGAEGKVMLRNYTAAVEIVAMLEAGKRYITRSERKGETVKIWLEDIATGKTVSEVESAQITWIKIHAY
jgi:hypothetical protein